MTAQKLTIAFLPARAQPAMSPLADTRTATVSVQPRWEARPHPSGIPPHVKCCSTGGSRGLWGCQFLPHPHFCMWGSSKPLPRPQQPPELTRFVLLAEGEGGEPPTAGARQALASLQPFPQNSACWTGAAGQVELPPL